jgi:hypothetical protein
MHAKPPVDKWILMEFAFKRPEDMEKHLVCQGDLATWVQPIYMDAEMNTALPADSTRSRQMVNHPISLPSKSIPCSGFKGKGIGFLSLFDR